MSLSFLLSGWERSAPAPNRPGISAPFGALGEFASRHQVHETIHPFDLYSQRWSSQNVRYANLHKIEGTGEAELPTLDAGLPSRQTHHGADEVVGQDRGEQFL